MSILIITSTFDREQLLLRAIKSVIDSFPKNYKYLHVVVNDSTVPLSNEVLSKASEKLIFLQNEVNSGKNISVHRTITEMGSDFNYALSLDDDDILLQDISRYNYEKVEYAIVAHPKLLTSSPMTAKSSPSLSFEYFQSAIDLVGARKKTEISFALRIDTYQKLISKITPLISRVGPELAIYDVVSRDAGGLIFQNYPVMACEYQDDGMTAGFRRRVRQNPGDFLAYYAYMAKNVVSLQSRLYFFGCFGYCVFWQLFNCMIPAFLRARYKG